MNSGDAFLCKELAMRDARLLGCMPAVMGAKACTPYVAQAGIIGSAWREDGVR